MTQLTNEHFELHDRNKAKVYEEQKQMRNEVKSFVESCSVLHLQELYSEIKRFKRMMKNKGE